MSESIEPEAAAQGEGRKVVRRAGVIAVFTLLSRILGYVRDAVLASIFGASATFDAFVVAQTIPNFLRRLVAEGALVIAYVPILSEERERGGQAAAKRFFAAVMGTLLPLLVLFVVFGVVFPDLVVEAFAPGFNPERAEIASRLTEIMMPYILFVSLMAIASGTLNVLGSYAPGAAAPILHNLAIIAMAVFAGQWFSDPIIAVGVGFTVGGMLQLLLQVPFLAKHDALVLPRFAPSDPGVRVLLKRMAPAVFGVAVYQINLMVIRQIGSFLPDGQLSCYYNATRLQEFALGVFAVSVSVAALPTLSEHAAKKDYGALLATYRRALKITNFVTVPATVALVLMSGPIVRVLFRHGNYSEAAAEMTAGLLQILGLAITPIGAVRVIVPTFYALGDTKTPVIGAAASLASTFIVGHALRGQFEIYGLTAATSFAALVQLLALGLTLTRAVRRRSTEVRTRSVETFVHGAKALVAALPGVGLSAVLAEAYGFAGGRTLLSGVILLCLVGLAVLLYFVFAKILRLEEADLVIHAIRRRIRRRPAA